MSTAVEQAVACTPVTQRVRVRSPFGTSFLGEVLSEFFLACMTNARKIYTHKVPEYHLAVKSSFHIRLVRMNGCVNGVCIVFHVRVVSETAPTLS